MSGSFLNAHDSSNLIIGSNCSFNHNEMLGAARGDILIGNDVLMGPNVVLRATDHLLASTEAPIHSQDHRPFRIMIGNDVWLAAN
jgi:galactoside O-acetyltransferase